MKIRVTITSVYEEEVDGDDLDMYGLTWEASSADIAKAFENDPEEPWLKWECSEDTYATTFKVWDRNTKEYGGEERQK